jgi:hypothetical protein
VDSSCERGNEPSGSIKCWETTEWLHNWWPLEGSSATQSQSVMRGLVRMYADSSCSQCKVRKSVRGMELERNTCRCLFQIIKRLFRGLTCTNCGACRVLQLFHDCHNHSHSLLANSDHVAQRVPHCSRCCACKWTSLCYAKMLIASEGKA